MNLINHWKSLLAAVAVVIVVFIAVSIFDVLVALVQPRFYSKAAFITVFGVGGIFAALMAYAAAIKQAPEKNELARWSIIITVIICGSLFFYPLSVIEGGEYEAAFKAFGITTALSVLLMAKGKVGL